jgi:hypothetical protein
MQNKILVGFLIFICGCASQINTGEKWIDYDSLSNINAGLSQKELKDILGEPLLVLGNNDSEENHIYLFYNYQVKRYISKNNQRDPLFERSILIKFTFGDDALISWEEDNITLHRALANKPKTGLIKYLTLLINLVLLGAVIGGS